MNKDKAIIFATGAFLIVSAAATMFACVTLLLFSGVNFITLASTGVVLSAAGQGTAAVWAFGAAGTVVGGLLLGGVATGTLQDLLWGKNKKSLSAAPPGDRSKPAASEPVSALRTATIKASFDAAQKPVVSDNTAAVVKPVDSLKI